MNSLRNASDNLLLEAYRKAIELKLDQDFCEVIKTEIKNRELLINDNQKDPHA